MNKDICATTTFSLLQSLVFVCEWLRSADEQQGRDVKGKGKAAKVALEEKPNPVPPLKAMYCHRNVTGY